MSHCVYVVHCIDTEGPLYEPLEATFDRLKEHFDLDLAPSPETLTRLQRGELDLGGRERAVQKMVAPQILHYYETWDTLDAMLHDAMSPAFRNQLPDANGNGWIYNWFCVDHVDYETNPRRRDVGYHNIFDHYVRLLRETGSDQDGLHFHYHPHPYLKHAHRSGTHWWAFSDSLSQIISRRIIDRAWFPTVNRPGFHVTRPDSHWFLEQYMPFDYANQALPVTSLDALQRGVADGRFGDWRRAPRTWTPYHPSHDDYQVPGTCRRWIARCLNVGTRHRLLDRDEVFNAFEAARAGQPTILSFTNHDFRDLRRDIQRVRDLLREASAAYPDVPFVFSEAIRAMREALQLPVQNPCSLQLGWVYDDAGRPTLNVHTDEPAFGPQPWLAIKTCSGQYLHDNFDIQTPFHAWSYAFDDNTVPFRAVERVGIAANNAYGQATIQVYDTASAHLSTTYLHPADALHTPA